MQRQRDCRRRAGQRLPGTTSGEGFQSDFTGFFPDRGLLSSLQPSAQRQSRPGECGVSMRICVCLAQGDSQILRSSAAQDRSSVQPDERPSEAHWASLSEHAVAGLKIRSPDRWTMETKSGARGWNRTTKAGFAVRCLAVRPHVCWRIEMDLNHQRAALQTAVLRWNYRCMVCAIGFEPIWTTSQTSRISHLPHTEKWWRQPASNRRPSACKTDALPSELCPHEHGASAGQTRRRHRHANRLRGQCAC